MSDKGIPANIITYRPLIDSLCKNNRVQSALKLFREIDAQGLAPHHMTYASLLNAKVDEAIAMLREM